MIPETSSHWCCGRELDLFESIISGYKDAEISQPISILQIKSSVMATSLTFIPAKLQGNLNAVLDSYRFTKDRAINGKTY